MKSKNLKTILAVEIVLVVCLCVGVVGIFFYLGGLQALTGGGGAPAAPLVEATATPGTVVEPTATEIPTVTPTPGPTGTLLEQLPDGGTKFTDYDAGYEITFPAGWLVLHASNEEFQEALKTKVAKNKDLKGALEAAITDGFDLERDRVLAYDTKPSSVKIGVLGYILVRWEKDYNRSIDEELQKSVTDIETNPKNQGAGVRVVSTDQIVNSNKVEIGRVGIKWNLTAENGNTVPMFMPINLFRVPSGMVLLMLTTPGELRADVEPDFTTIVDQIKLLGK
jgi:hypothetical protein